MDLRLKSGWYKKGKTYRFLLGMNSSFFYMYQTKTKFGSNEVIGVNAMMDKWFKDAEYIGLKLEVNKNRK